jgi:Putative  PD-(D/E)XK family member, (DUF4420)
LNGDAVSNLFRRLSEAQRPGGTAAFSALAISGSNGHMAARSIDGRSALLLLTAPGGPRPADIHLSGLNATFDITCTVAIGDAPLQDRRMTILECTADADAMPLFAESAGAFLRLLGERPSMAETAAAVARFASIFSALSRPSRQSVTGLIGELMLLLLASDPAGAIACWRVSPTDSFDFVGTDARVECKASSTRLRLHSFSWEQCNPPEGPALVASLQVEAAGGGTSLRSLIERVEARLAAAPDAAVRLRETIASTMGLSLMQALDTTFDEVLCRGSLQWFDLREIPAVRGDLPPGVGGLRFLSDVSQAQPIAASPLQATALEALVPRA